MGLADQQIQWLTEEEVEVFDNFTRMMSYAGTFSRSSKTKRVFAYVFWPAVYIPMMTALLATAFHYIENLDFLAYTLHHFILLAISFVVTHVTVPKFCPQIYYVMDASKNTYDYGSDLVDSYGRKIIRERINLSRLMTKMIYFVVIGITTEVQAVLEAVRQLTMVERVTCVPAVMSWKGIWTGESAKLMKRIFPAFVLGWASRRTIDGSGFIWSTFMRDNRSRALMEPLSYQLFFAIESFYLKTYKTVFPLYIGLDLNDPLVFVSVVLWQELVVYYTAILPVILSIISYSAWSHLDLEMRILTFAIANVQKIVKEKSGKRSREGVDDRPPSELYESYCRHFAKHHISIIKYFNAFSQAVSWISPIIFTTGVLLFITVGLSTMSDNLGIKLKLFWFLVVQLIVIYVWCLVGQYIGDKSEEISEVVVSAPWWLMPASCRSTLLLIMTRCRRPMKLATPFGTDVNMKSFMEMLKSVYQVTSLIYQMKNN